MPVCQDNVICIMEGQHIREIFCAGTIEAQFQLEYKRRMQQTATFEDQPAEIVIYCAIIKQKKCQRNNGPSVSLSL